MSFLRFFSSATLLDAGAKQKTNSLLRFSYIRNMEAIKNIISIDPEILGGQPVFKGTRVPVDTMFLHLEQGLSLYEFLEDFPTVTREQAVGVLELAEKLVTSKNIQKLYKAAA
jgi:uncharacterized protein (DUF433 family)